MSEMKVKRLLTAEETAAALGLRVSTIRRMLLERRITSVKIGRAVRIPSEVVDQIIKQGWREPVGLER